MVEINDGKIRIKAVHNNEVMVTYVDPEIDLLTFRKEIQEMFKFKTHIFAMKYIDEDGDPCILESVMEFIEAIRLYENNKDSEITVHVFSGIPKGPGLPCPGEDKNIYRRGARRWRKLYKVNGHLFQPKRFNRRAFCVICDDRIWGLGRQGFKCIQCKVMVHKKCHKLIKLICMVGGAEESIKSRDGYSPPEKTRRMQRKYEYKAITPSKGDKQVEVVGNENAGRQYSLEDFDLIRVIGRGSYAKVLLVELKKTKRPYAMKVIKKEIVTDDEDIDWVQTEKHVFEIATGCEFLVGLHSCFQTESKLFFVIEFVSGGDLMFHMQRYRRLPETHARFYAAEISLALNYLHEKGIIYRDLKLDNVLLDRHGHIKLTDYGMCKEGIRPGDYTCTFCGTPNYIAPEILKGLDYSFPVDWWALGVLLYEMLAGRSPFDLEVIRENPDQHSEDYLFQLILEKTIRIPRSLSVKAQSVLKGFLQKDPAERLGCDLENGFEDIKNHHFFKPIDWDALREKRINPPYEPKIEDDLLEHFDPAFINEPVVLTPPNMDLIEKIDQSEFEGFEFINPEIMTVEDAV